MIQASRILIIAFLALAQMIGPLVHAHTGGAPSPGIVHLPGLERLARPDGVQAQLPGGEYSHDVVVALSPGLEISADTLLSPSDPQPQVLPACTFKVPSGRAPPVVVPPCPEPSSPPERKYPAISPRAPPV